MKKTLALILAILMLCSVAAIATSAEDAAIDWEGLYAKYGINVYVGAATDTPPTLDGIIATGEYTYERTIEYAALFESSPGEIQSELKEYFAHDANYIYIGAEFEQKNDNRAYWIQWRPYNTFDVFRDDSNVDAYYYQRISTQIRYQEDGSVTNSGWGWTRPVDHATPTLDGDNPEYKYVAAKIIDEAAEKYTKTIEVRISKQYIATLSECAVSDVRVMPYWTWFHANLCNAAPLTTDLAVEISELDFTTYVPNDATTYWFLVLDEAPEGYTPVPGYQDPNAGEDEGGDVVVTDPIVTEPATTTAAETTAATTTAAPTTAAETTAAETEAAKGCGSSLTISALAMIPAIAGGALLIKRRED